MSPVVPPWSRPKRPRFLNRKTVVDGVEFDSKGEAARYHALRLLQRIGDIRDLERQVRFALVVNDMRVCDYIADFTYRLRDDDTLVVEDYKSPRTRTLADYRIKVKLMLACRGITVKESGDAKRG